MLATSRPQRHIILLHGFAAHWSLMWPLQKYFERSGCQVTNWSYNSWFRPIREHSSRLVATIRELDADSMVDTIDFVTHSMGCIVTRAALLNYRPQKCGRWVMLAPPNHGSRAASRFSPVVGGLMKPVDELRRSPDSYVNRLPIPQDLDIAIVQATKDWIVDAESTRIPEERDRYVVPTLHSSMLFRDDVAKQCLHFLQHGEFDKP